MEFLTYKNHGFAYVAAWTLQIATSKGVTPHNFGRFLILFRFPKAILYSLPFVTESPHPTSP